MQKKLIARIAAVLAVTLIFFVFLSKTIYNRTLPSVKSVKVECGYVARTWEGVGNISYPNAVVMKAGGDWTTSEVLVEDGDFVEEGDLLCLFETKSFDIEQKNLELDILRLKNELAAISEQSAEATKEASSRNRKREEIIATLEFAIERLETFDANGFGVEEMNLQLDILRLRNELAANRELEPETDEEERAQRRNRGELLLALEIAETKLANLNAKDFKMERKALELDILRLKNELAELDENNSGSIEQHNQNRSAAQIASELAIAEARLNLAVSTAPPTDGLYAPSAGRIYELSAKSGEALAKGTVMMLLAADDTPSLKFSMPPKEGEIFGPGTTVQMTLETVAQNDHKENVFARKTAHGKVISGVLKGDKWECLASVPRLDGRPVGGQDIPIKISYQGERQDIVVPVGCLYKKNHTTIVYIIKPRTGLFGTENYLLEKEVEVLYDNGKLAALEKGSGIYQDMLLACDASREVYSGDAVWIRENDAILQND